ncbi:TolB family protein [Reichenbachiella sp.]
MKKILLLILISVMATQTFAQLGVSFGQNPNGQNWQKLESPKIDIVYPQGKEAQAQRIANLINYQGSELTGTIGPIVKKPNMLIQNHTVISNGFVGLAPFRSEFFTTSPANSKIFGSIGWLDILSIHEYRHVLQNSNALNGFTNFLRYFQGERGWSLGRLIVTPNWFMEGDAVWAETKFSSAGRGRLPHFTKEQRAILASGNTYKYQKYRNGSFKTQLPSHYPTGYLICSYLRNEEGAEVWNEILADATAWKSVVWSFNNAIKRNSKYRNSDRLFYAAWDKMGKQWEEQKAEANVQPGEVISEERKTATYYTFPQETASGSVVAWRKSFQKTDQIIEISNGTEKVLFAPGFNLWQYFNTKDGAFVWPELSQDPRRNNESYSDLYVKKSANAPSEKLTEKGKYFSPVFGKNTDEIYAVLFGSDLIPSLRKFNVLTKEEEEVITFTPSEFIGRITYVEEDNSMLAVYRINNQMTLLKIDLTSGDRTELVPRTYHAIDEMSVSNGYVYFTGSYSGIDNIYRAPLDGSKKLDQLTSEAVGAYNPSVSNDGKTIYYVTYDDLGHQIAKRSNEVINKNEAFSYLEPRQMVWQDETPSLFEDKNASILTLAPDTEYSTAEYTKSPFRGGRVHSWSIIPSPVTPGLALQMNNYTNDISGELSGGYNTNEKGAFFGASVSYARLFPVITLGVEHNFRSADYLMPADTLADLNYAETVLGGAVSIPLNWIKGNYTTSLTPAVGYDYHITNNLEVDETNITFEDTNYSTLEGGLAFSFLRRTAEQNLAPRLGISLSASIIENLTESSNNKFVGIGKIYLPGVGMNHTLQLTGAYQYEPLDNIFQEVDAFQYSRGYTTPINDDFLRLSVDYGFPLLYPDLGFFGITYFKRIRANLFYDLGKGSYDQADVEIDYNSTGFEIIFDNTMLNLIPISFGFRGSYLLDTDPQDTDAEFVTGIFISGNF